MTTTKPPLTKAGDLLSGTYPVPVEQPAAARKRATATQPELEKLAAAAAEIRLNPDAVEAAFMARQHRPRWLE